MEYSQSDLLLYDSVLNRIYASRASLTPDNDYLRGIGELLHTDSCIVVISQKDGHQIVEACGAGVSSHSIESPASGAAQRLWSLDPALRIRDAAIILREDAVRSRAEYRDFFHHCLHPFRLAPFISVNIGVDERRNLCLRLARLQGRRDFDTTELEVAKTLARHLCTAYRSRTTELEQPLDVGLLGGLTAAADKLRIGLAVIDSEQTVCFSNQRARRDLAQLPLDTLRQKLGQGAVAISSDEPTRSGQPLPVEWMAPASFLLEVEAGSDAVRFLSYRVQPPTSADRKPRPYTILFSNRASCSDGIDPGVLERLFGLTPAEARVAALLAQGLSVDEIATALCKSRNTIRAHNRSLHTKLMVNNQAQLTWKILSSLAGLIDF